MSVTDKFYSLKDRMYHVRITAARHFTVIQQQPVWEERQIHIPASLSGTMKSEACTIISHIQWLLFTSRYRKKMATMVT